ncbi:MAG: hypothetical protein ACRD41_17830, partial [Candidatus Acidiferrales bacterium]
STHSNSKSKPEVARRSYELPRRSDLAALLETFFRIETRMHEWKQAAKAVFLTLGRNPWLNVTRFCVESALEGSKSYEDVCAFAGFVDLIQLDAFRQ